MLAFRIPNPLLLVQNFPGPAAPADLFRLYSQRDAPDPRKSRQTLPGAPKPAVLPYAVPRDTLGGMLDGGYEGCGVVLIMTKCTSCSGSIREGETVCFLCDTPVPPSKMKVTAAERFQTVIKITFIVSAIMTVASLFFDFTPSFTKCMVATMILGLVKSSGDQMIQKL